jgi:Transposase DDE domain
VRGPSPHHLRRYAAKCLGLHAYLESPGEGRPQPRIGAAVLLWALLAGRLLRCLSFAAVEGLVRSSARRALPVSRRFGDDTLSYFTERLDPAVTRAAATTALRQAKRNKAFDNCRFIGLAVDGTGAGRSRQEKCSLCRASRNSPRGIVGYQHQLVLISVVGAGLTLPFDVEPYGPGDSEYAAGQRLLRRAVSTLGKRFAQYVVVDGEFATSPFLHAADDLGLYVVARLKENLPELHAAAQQRFRSQSPTTTFWHGEDWVEIWDADDFDPWETLRWTTVRVIFYRQHKRDGTVIEASWLTDFPCSWVGPVSLFRLAKSRWEIENQGFNDAKNRYGFEHICHHEPHSLLIVWLLTCLALIVERLYRLRYLHRGQHPVRTAIALLRLLQLSLSAPAVADSS